VEYKKYEKIAEQLKVLAHPVRICIIRGLSERERSVNEMCDCLNSPQPTISLHLSKMRAAGIVEGERQGNSMIYRIKDKIIAKMILALTEE
jgi:ArsR family transcriptional regulator